MYYKAVFQANSHFVCSKSIFIVIFNVPQTKSLKLRPNGHANVN